nr:glycosyltransferase family 1 protein [Deltaproteobacteria bacterium]
MTIEASNRYDASDILFFSHLRWDFVQQRPQHIASRWATQQQVSFWEEPVHDATSPRLEIREAGPVTVLTPHLRPDDREPDHALRLMLDGWVRHAGIHRPVGYYWTPMMRSFSDHLPFSAVVWDCMDELSAFAFAPPDLLRREAEMLRSADVVFTGGHEIYRAKRHRHGNIHPMPSSVDFRHFAQARKGPAEPGDQARIPRPRIGWFGVIDERTDIALIDTVAASNPDWHLVMIGPVVKISPDTLPRRPNIHWLGMKAYAELPAYVAHWDVAMLPFAINDATRFISPTKTPEYLAAGKPVVSTPIADVIRPYGEKNIVRIADGADAFAAEIRAALVEDPAERLARADVLLATTSWDATVA